MIKLKTFICASLAIGFSLPSIAGSMGEIPPEKPSSQFSVGAFGGYGAINGAYGQDGNFSQARLSGDYMFHLERFQNVWLGAELGVQSGNTMRLKASQNIMNSTGGLPVQSVLKPFVDLLVSTKISLSDTSPFSLILKGGIAYRQLQLQDRTSISDTLGKVNGEFQAGLGYNLTEHVAVNLTYQGIYNTNNAKVSINNAGDIAIAQIPTQQAGFLGVVYSF
jgi:hypothetical protein